MFAVLKLLGAVLPIFTITGLGFFMRRSGKLTSEADASLMRLTVNLLYPCLILSSLMNNRVVNDPVNIVFAPLLGFGTLAVGYGLGLILGRMLKMPDVTARTFAFVAGIFNYGYIAVPLIILLYDRGTLGVLWLFTLGVETTFWTLGFMVLRGSSWRDGLRQLLSPPIIAIIIGVVFNWTGADAYLPKFATNTVDLIGGCAIPIALVTIGATIADYWAEFNPQDDWRGTLGGIALRQIALPLIFILAACWLPCSLQLKRVLVVQAAMPCAMFPILVTKHEGGDVGLALRVVLCTSLLGIITIPLWLKFGMQAIERFTNITL